jgi:hypothetical protein
MKNFNNNTENEEEWITPPEIIQALGVFDLDPCSPPPERRMYDTAKIHYSKEEHGDGLTMPWSGRVWLNPPYGRETFKWLEKLSIHKSGIALIFARTETIGFHETVWNKANGIFFFKGRLKFGRKDNHKFNTPANAPSCLVSYSCSDTNIIKQAQMNGFIVGKLIRRKIM